MKKERVAKREKQDDKERFFCMWLPHGRYRTGITKINEDIYLKEKERTIE
jgi:hypothetical protein